MRHGFRICFWPCCRWAVQRIFRVACCCWWRLRIIFRVRTRIVRLCSLILVVRIFLSDLSWSWPLSIRSAILTGSLFSVWLWNILVFLCVIAWDLWDQLRLVLPLRWKNYFSDCSSIFCCLIVPAWRLRWHLFVFFILGRVSSDIVCECCACWVCNQWFFRWDPAWVIVLGGCF